MSRTLAEHFALIEDEYADALAHPLSARRAMLVAALLARFTDRVFERYRPDAPDRVFSAADGPAYRDRLRAASPALATIFALCTVPPGAALEVAPVEVPIADYGRLSVEDFMVSLYNGNTVQRVVITRPGEGQPLVHPVLGEAIAWWRGSGAVA